MASANPTHHIFDQSNTSALTYIHHKRNSEWPKGFAGQGPYYATARSTVERYIESTRGWSVAEYDKRVREHWRSVHPDAEGTTPTESQWRDYIESRFEEMREIVWTSGSTEAQVIDTILHKCREAFAFAQTKHAGDGADTATHTGYTTNGTKAFENYVICQSHEGRKRMEEVMLASYTMQWCILEATSVVCRSQ